MWGPEFKHQNLLPSPKKKKKKPTQSEEEWIIADRWWLTLVILAAWEADIQKIMGPGHHRQDVHKTPCHSSEGGKPKIGGSWSKASLGKKWDLISKIIRGQRAGGMAQAVECLPSKEKALSSNLSIFFFHFSFIIHMCIQGLVHFSPLTPPPPLSPSISEMRERERERDLPSVFTYPRPVTVCSSD
jgi:hypothetical protein